MQFSMTMAQAHPKRTRPSLCDLAAVGSFVSDIAAVFSFIFLALQIRQANRNQKSLMQQGRSASNVDIL
jgi:hypothetical protein